MVVRQTFRAAARRKGFSWRHRAVGKGAHVLDQARPSGSSTDEIFVVLSVAPTPGSTRVGGTASAARVGWLGSAQFGAVRFGVNERAARRGEASMAQLGPARAVRLGRSVRLVRLGLSVRAA